MTWMYDDELIDKVSLAKLFVIVNVGGLLRLAGHFGQIAKCG
jgi:hypothetical protein